MLDQLPVYRTTGITVSKHAHLTNCRIKGTGWVFLKGTSKNLFFITSTYSLLHREKVEIEFLDVP
ncbi:MAG: hypothetical protein ACOVMQ_08335 [Cyclobacteriaceae bacterium]|jgi:hypothetical protein